MQQDIPNACIGNDLLSWPRTAFAVCAAQEHCAAGFLMLSTLTPSVADPDPFDPDPAFQFDPDLDPAYQFDTNPDPTV
jgi:hypothetical protein